MLHCKTFAIRIVRGIASAGTNGRMTFKQVSASWRSLFEESIRRYMKSYFPKLDSPEMLLSIAWAAFLEIERRDRLEKDMHMSAREIVYWLSESSLKRCQNLRYGLFPLV